MEGYLIELVLEDAKRWVDGAISFYEKNGKEIALSEFSNPEGRFVRGEQYVYALDINGVMLAHPVNERYVGKDFYRVQDADGKRFIKDIVDTANTRGFGWVAYKWFDPATRAEQPKTVYFEKVDSMIVCSGVYGGNPALDALDHALDDMAFLTTPAGGAVEFSEPPFGQYPKAHLEDDLMELVPDDAKRWVEKAIAFYRANGREIALAEFANPKGRFVRDELYVYVVDFNGTMLAHPVNERYVGKDFYRIQDSDGRKFIKEIVDTADSSGSGWVEYKWFNPANRREQTKMVYFEKVNGMIFCSGIYEQ